MRYRAPIRSMRAARALPGRGEPAQGSILDVARLIEELHTIKENHRAAVDELLAETAKKFDTELTRLQAIRDAGKGDPGILPIAGVHYPIPQNGKDADEAAIERRLHARLKEMVPEAVDPQDVADLVVEMLPPPEAGKAGEDADPEAVAAAVVEKLKSEQALRPEHIAGLPEIIADVRRQAGGTMRGGGDTVVAGTNVTISKNTAGRKVINASGGFTQLAATETPNGTTVVFTFAAATAQPSFLLVDNVWMKATSKAGTVNWTWNNGTKKATLTVAPGDDILGIV